MTAPSVRRLPQLSGAPFPSCAAEGPRGSLSLWVPSGGWRGRAKQGLMFLPKMITLVQRTLIPNRQESRAQDQVRSSETAWNILEPWAASTGRAGGTTGAFKQYWYNSVENTSFLRITCPSTPRQNIMTCAICYPRVSSETK